MDKLEQFLSDNRGSFDVEMPSEMVWRNIENRLDATAVSPPVSLTSSGSRLRTWALRVAAAVVFLVAGIGLGKTVLKDKIPLSSNNSEINVAKSLEDAEDFYNKKVQSKINQLVAYNPDPSVMEDLKQIDEVQAELRRELDHAPQSSREEIIQTMIKNYKIKLDILERVLQHVQQGKMEESSNTLPRKHDTII